MSTYTQEHITQRALFGPLNEKWESTIRERGENPYGINTPPSIVLGTEDNNPIKIWRPLPRNPDAKLCDFGTDRKDSITVSYTDVAAGIIYISTVDQSTKRPFIEGHSLDKMEGVALTNKTTLDPKRLLEVIQSARDCE